MRTSQVVRSTLPFWHGFHITLTIIAWMCLLYTIFFVHPAGWQSIYFAPFFILLFFTLFFSLLLFTKNVLVSIIPPLFLNIILILRLLGIKDWLNPLLISCLGGTLIYFFTVKDDSDTLTSSSIKQSVPAQHQKTEDKLS